MRVNSMPMRRTPLYILSSDSYSIPTAAVRGWPENPQAIDPCFRKVVPSFPRHGPPPSLDSWDRKLALFPGGEKQEALQGVECVLGGGLLSSPPTQ